MTGPGLNPIVVPGVVGAHTGILAVTLGTVLVVVLGASLVTGAVRSQRHRRWEQGAQQILITPPVEVDPAGATMWWAHCAALLRQPRHRVLLHGQPHLGVEFTWTARELQIRLWVPGGVPAAPLAAGVRAAWPGADTTITPATTPLPAAGVHARESGADVRVRVAGARMAPARPAWFPLASDHPADPLRALLMAGAQLHSTETGCVQVLLRPATASRIRGLRHASAHPGGGSTRAGIGALGSGGLPHSLSARGVGGGGVGLLLALTSRALGALLTETVNLFTQLITPARTTTRTPNTAQGRVVRDPVAERHARAGLDKLMGAPFWEAAIRIGVAHTEPASNARQARAGADGEHEQRILARLSSLVHGLGAAWGVFEGPHNRWHLRAMPHADAVLAGRVLNGGFVLSTPEVASMLGLPTDAAVPGLARARAKSMPAPVAVPGGGRGVKVLGRARLGGHSVGVPVVDAREHLHVIGSTGVGKSTLLTQLILADAKAGRAVVVIDPKGDLALDVMDRLPEGTWGRVSVIDPDQDGGGATFNPLELRPGSDADLMVDNLVNIFSEIFQRHWGPRIDDVLRVSCLTLMRYPNPTLINVPPLLTSKQFRSRFTAPLSDVEGLAGFWEWFDTSPAGLRAQVIGPVLARLRAFLLRDFVRSTIGIDHGSLNLPRLLDRGGILIARLPKGQLGHDTSALMGSLLLSSIWQAATARAGREGATRRDASVVIDEAHNVLHLAGSVADILAEARGYHLSLTLAHQDLSQLNRDALQGISANARNKIIFACSPEDARVLARHTLPELDEHDLAHLPAFNAAARLMVANSTQPAFTLATTAPSEPIPGNRVRLRAYLAAKAQSQGPPDARREAAPGAPNPETESLDGAGTQPGASVLVSGPDPATEAGLG